MEQTAARSPPLQQRPIAPIAHRRIAHRRIAASPHRRTNFPSQPPAHTYDSSLAWTHLVIVRVTAPLHHAIELCCWVWSAEAFVTYPLTATPLFQLRPPYSLKLAQHGMFLAVRGRR